MKRAFTTIVLALVALIAAFAYLHHRQVVKQRQEFDAFSPAVSSHTPPANSSPAPANAPSLVQQLPANASAVIFADIAALRSSSFANELASLAPTSAQDPAYTQFVQATGFDYSRDLNRTALALWPQTSPTSALALAQGRFNQEKIEHYALRTGRLVRIHNQKVYEVREENSSRLVRFTFLAPDEIALADGPALSQVLGPQNSVRLDPQMSALISRISGAPIYAVARTEDLPKDIGIDASHSAQLAAMLRSIHAISAAGRPSGDNLKIFASADCDSTLDALKLSTALQGLLWMGRAALADSKMQQQIGPEWPGFDAMLKAADISHDSHLLQLRIQLTPQMLQAVMTPPPNTAAGK